MVVGLWWICLAGSADYQTENCVLPTCRWARCYQRPWWDSEGTRNIYEPTRFAKRPTSLVSIQGLHLSENAVYLIQGDHLLHGPRGQRRRNRNEAMWSTEDFTCSSHPFFNMCTVSCSVELKWDTKPLNVSSPAGPLNPSKNCLLLHNESSDRLAREGSLVGVFVSWGLRDTFVSLFEVAFEMRRT